MPKGSSSSYVGDTRHIAITTRLSKAFEKIVAGNLCHFRESNSLLPPYQFSYRTLGTFQALLTLSYHLQVAMNRSMEERLVQLNFSAAFHSVSHRGLLYKL